MPKPWLVDWRVLIACELAEDPKPSGKETAAAMQERATPVPGGEIGLAPPGVSGFILGNLAYFGRPISEGIETPGCTFLREASVAGCLFLPRADTAKAQHRCARAQSVFTPSDA